MSGRPSTTRRRLLKGTGAVTAAGLTAAVTAPAADASAHHGAGPAGVWAVQVTIDQRPGEIERAHFSFGGDGQLVVQTINASHTGLGLWRRTGESRFVFVLRHLWTDGAGAFRYEVRIRHEARLTSPTTFVSDGTGTAVDAAGNILLTVRAKVTGTRFGIDDF
ncbi:hypothetical protein [Streptomyces sp. NBC_00829]|uniref:hypothetical protein n=1 Tax=Streptomyces sp. NBC_00829 TaxID=2903679 RepID=UPI00386F1411|nr:hypothetical protein OG293_04915 [Streptomyces sp. NBC_00829]